MDLNKPRNLVKSFIIYLGSYCPVAWFFHSPNLINKIKQLREKDLRLSYQNNLNFSEVLDLVDFVTIHYKNSQELVTEINKVEKSIGQ